MNHSFFRAVRLHAFAALVTLAFQPAAHAADITAVVGNVTQDTGSIMLGLFDNAQSFPKTPVKGVKVNASERNAQGQVRLVLQDVAPGDYAASAYQDLNGDGKLNTNLMGLPTEPYGFSKNARGAFGPPDFKDAAFTVPAQGVTIELQVK